MAKFALFYLGVLATVTVLAHGEELDIKVVSKPDGCDSARKSKAGDKLSMVTTEQPHAYSHFIFSDFTITRANFSLSYFLSSCVFFPIALYGYYC
jgi:hypothetical protein